LAEGRYRCGRCRYTFGLFTRRWLGQARLPLRQWAWVLKLFELEVTARQAAVQTGLSYPTVLRAFTLIRQAILAQEEPALLPLLGREVELDESYFGPHRSKRTRGGKRGRGALHKIPVFGILERRGRVTVSVVPDVTRATLLAAIGTCGSIIIGGSVTVGSTSTGSKGSGAMPRGSSSGIEA
jgi:transposase